jgi:hypothetical protein
VAGKNRKDKVDEMKTAVKPISEQQAPKVEEIQIKAPNFKVATFALRGTSPYVQLRFSVKAREGMRKKQEEGGLAKGRKARVPRKFLDEFEQAMYRSSEGFRGIPAGAFRAALISACRTVDFKMTIAKLTVFILQDGADEIDGTPLVKIEGKPERVEHTVRNATGVADIRTRAMWREWKLSLRVRYDADRFADADIANLVMRAGAQVGVGEGRPDSKASCGMGWGLFEIQS